ncbi:MBL fold metallo-hydrolase [Lysinibacillus xylanilyticus]|uniref:MBL fold metallo-hydrolase n=1 Tax=Lysinibacillus xylanilyticus TaxID=582475 RepID=UPI00382BE179
MLKFIGTGSAFNTALGNNSAYYKYGEELVLVDCGSGIFERIVNSNLLENVNHITVLVTHTHADHVGSLADLIFYMYYSHGELFKNKVKVLHSEGVEIQELLRINGVTKDVEYSIEEIGDGDRYHFDNTFAIAFDESKHVDNMKSYSIDFMLGRQLFHYSGDIRELGEFTVEFMEDGTYDMAFIDTCSKDYEGNVHLSLNKLYHAIRAEDRHKVWCMHLDNNFDVELAESLGFNVVKAEVQL